jgi:hypothetical protein
MIITTRLVARLKVVINDASAGMPTVGILFRNVI